MPRWIDTHCHLDAAEFAGDRVGKDLAGLHPRPAFGPDRLACKVDGFMEATARMIGADGPPQRQGIVPQPAQQPLAMDGELGFDIARLVHSYP